MSHAALCRRPGLAPRVGALGVAVARWSVGATVLGLALVVLVTTVTYRLAGMTYASRQDIGWDPVWLTVPGALLLGLALWLAERGLSRLSARARRVLLGGLLGAACWGWALGTRATTPRFDMARVADAATRLAGGDAGPMHETYLQMYPFQIGPVAYHEVLAVVSGGHTVTAARLVNGLLVAVTLVLAGRIAARLADERAETWTLLLGVTFLPWVLHSILVYGDSPGLACSTGALLLTVAFLQRGGGWRLVGVAALLGVGMAVRTNVVITALAIVAVLLVVALQRRTWRLGAAAGLVLVATMLPAPLVQRGYETAYRADLGAGMPSSYWLAMSMSEGDGGAGWWGPAMTQAWNQAARDGRPADVAVPQAVIRQRLGAFVGDPGLGATFYARKLVSQWADPEHEALRQLSHQRVEPGRSGLADAVVDGPVTPVVWRWSDAHQSLVALGVLAWLGLRWRRARVVELLPGVVVLGGLLFSLLWEAKARYVLAYYPCLLVYAGIGLAALMSRLRREHA